MQVKWHLDVSYCKSSGILGYDLLHASPKVLLVSYCQSNPSSHQERLVTMVMDYNTGPHACQRECW